MQAQPGKMYPGKKLLSVCFVALSISALAACTDTQQAQQTPGKASEDKQVKDEMAASIGSAYMEADGTIVLHLSHRGEGMVADGQVTYKPGDEHYQEVLQHLGGLKPGETKPVPPWPDNAN